MGKRKDRAKKKGHREGVAEGGSSFLSGWASPCSGMAASIERSKKGDRHAVWHAASQVRGQRLESGKIGPA